MTYLLLSLRRPYTALMLAGKKTLEIRKTAPREAKTVPADAAAARPLYGLV